MKRVAMKDVELYGALGGQEAWVWAIKAWRCRQTDVTSCRLAGRCLGKAVQAVKAYRGPIGYYLGGKRFADLGEHGRIDKAASFAWDISIGYTLEWNLRLGYISAYLRPETLRDPNTPRSRDEYRQRNRLRRLPAKARRYWRRQEHLLQEMADEDGIDRLRHPSASTLQQQDDNELRREGSRVC